MLAEGAQSLIDLLGKIGVDFQAAGKCAGTGKIFCGWVPGEYSRLVAERRKRCLERGLVET